MNDWRNIESWNNRENRERSLEENFDWKPGVCGPGLKPGGVTAGSSLLTKDTASMLLPCSANSAAPPIPPVVSGSTWQPIFYQSEQQVGVSSSESWRKAESWRTESDGIRPPEWLSRQLKIPPRQNAGSMNTISESWRNVTARDNRKAMSLKPKSTCSDNQKSSKNKNKGEGEVNSNICGTTNYDLKAAGCKRAASNTLDYISKSKYEVQNIHPVQSTRSSSADFEDRASDILDTPINYRQHTQNSNNGLDTALEVDSEATENKEDPTNVADSVENAEANDTSNKVENAECSISFPGITFRGNKSLRVVCKKVNLSDVREYYYNDQFKSMLTNQPFIQLTKLNNEQLFTWKAIFPPTLPFYHKTKRRTSVKIKGRSEARKAEIEDEKKRLNESATPSIETAANDLCTPVNDDERCDSGSIVENEWLKEVSKKRPPPGLHFLATAPLPSIKIKKISKKPIEEGEVKEGKSKRKETVEEKWIKYCGGVGRRPLRGEQEEEKEINKVKEASLLDRDRGRRVVLNTYKPPVKPKVKKRIMPVAEVKEVKEKDGKEEECELKPGECRVGPATPPGSGPHSPLTDHYDDRHSDLQMDDSLVTEERGKVKENYKDRIDEEPILAPDIDPYEYVEELSNPGDDDHLKKEEERKEEYSSMEMEETQMAVWPGIDFDAPNAVNREHSHVNTPSFSRKAMDIDCERAHSGLNRPPRGRLPLITAPFPFQSANPTRPLLSGDYVSGKALLRPPHTSGIMQQCAVIGREYEEQGRAAGHWKGALLGVRPRHLLPPPVAARIRPRNGPYPTMQGPAQASAAAFPPHTFDEVASTFTVPQLRTTLRIMLRDTSSNLHKNREQKTKAEELLKVLDDIAILEGNQSPTLIRQMLQPIVSFVLHASGI